MSAAARVASGAGQLSLYQLLDPAVLADPYPLFRRLRSEDPVHWDPFLRVWVVTRYADVVTVLRQFSAARAPNPEQLAAMRLPDLAPIAQVMARQMLFLDPPAHTRLRALAAAAFTPRRVESLGERIQQIADRLVDGFAARGRCDLMAEFAGPLPAIVTAELLGVPVEDHAQLRAWTTDFGEILGNFQYNADRVARVRRSLDGMSGYFEAAIRERRQGRRQAGGLLSALLEADVDGGRLSDEEVIATTIITMVGGQETTTNLIGNGILTLLRHPTALEQLRTEAALLPGAVEELLRYESPSQHTARLAPEDLELGGRPIRKRQAVIAVMAAGNRDPERFPEPDRVDLARADKRHLAFGWGAHFCFGAMLARLEGSVAFATLLRRLPGLTLGPGPLSWRMNLGLRGLTDLPLRWDAVAAGVPARPPARPAA